MDILNWLYLRKEQLIRKTANNPVTDLVALGADATFAKRDDKYKTYAMTLKDATQSGCVANNTLTTGILDTFPYIITPGLNKTATQVIDPTTELTLEGWKVEGTIILAGAPSYSLYLGTITIKNYNGSPVIPFNTTGTVSYDTMLPNYIGFEPLGLFNSALIGGVGDYAQFAFTTASTVIGTDLLIDIDLYASSAPFTVGIGNLEATVSFRIETLIEKGLDVTFNI